MHKVKWHNPHLAQTIKHFTTDHLIFGPDDLLIFVDDTGHELLPRGHLMFGLGGCAIFGRHYDDRFIDEWRRIKELAFKCSKRCPFHAKEHLLKMVSSERRCVETFIRDVPCKNFSHTISSRTMIGDDYPLMQSALRGIVDHVENLVDLPARRDEWIFERSQRTQSIILNTDVFMAYSRSSSNGGLWFMRKSKAEAGLEWADFVIYIAGDHLRSQINGRTFRYTDFYTAMFGDPGRGTDTTVLAMFGASVGPSI